MEKKKRREESKHQGGIPDRYSSFPCRKWKEQPFRMCMYVCCIFFFLATLVHVSKYRYLILGEA